jgi:SSS family solute:Na+ symporter
MIQLFVIVGYLAALLMLGLFASRFSRGTSGDYMLASHTIGPVLLLMSLFGTTMTAFALVGSTGQAWRFGAGVFGLMASAAGIVHSLCFLIIGVPLWAAGRRHGFRTQIQYFRSRLDSPLTGLLLFPVLVGFVVTYLLLGIVGAGAVVNEVTAGAFQSRDWFANSGYGVPRALASAVVCAVVLAYVFFGGMRGTAWANAMQTALFMVLGVITFVTIAFALGRGDTLVASMTNATRAAPESHLAREMFTRPQWFAFLLIPLSVGMFPHVFQHWLTARSARTFKLPIIMHPIFVMIVWAPCVMIGVWAAGSGIEFSGINAVLGKLVQQFATPLLGGLLTAGILAAIMSSLDSQFLCLGTMFSEDIVRDTLRLDLGDRQMVWITRMFVVLIVAITYGLSFVVPSSVFDLGIWSFSGFTGLFPLVLAAIYWRRLSVAGAVACILTTVVAWGFLFYRSGFGANKQYRFPEQALAVGPFELPPFDPVLTIFVLSTLALIIVSLITPPPERRVVDRFF